MSIVRSIIVCCIISLIAGIGLFYLGSFAGYEQFKGGYAVLSFSSDLSDQELRQRLDSGRPFFGGMPISESSSWVMLDNFGELERVPLTQYESRVLPFDPRNDGYADKLRNFFVRGGKRYIFVPLMPGNWKDSFLDKQFANLMQDIPFSVDYFGTGKPVSLFFAAFGVSSLGLFILCFIRKNIQLWTVNILTLIPLFSSLSFFGAEGILAAAILFGAFFLVREPLYELATMHGLFAFIFSKNKKREHNINYKIKKEIYEPYKKYWKSLILSVISLVLLVVFTPLKLLFLLVLFMASLGVFAASSKIISSDEGSRRRFSPVAIMKKRRVEFDFFYYMIPFAIGSLAVFVFSPFFPGSFHAEHEYTLVLTEEDYNEHILYQASFSITQLGTNKTDYYNFTTGQDGLPLAPESKNNEYININDLPAFPLKHLIDFLNNANNE